MVDFNFKKAYKDLYITSNIKEPMFAEVPSFNQIYIQAQGEPMGEEFVHNSLPALYKMAYTIKMDKGRESYQAFTVAPLEGFWTTNDNKEYDGNKEKLVFTLFLNMPKFVTEDIFAKYKQKVLEDKKLDKALKESVLNVHFRQFEERKCAQILHIGKFEDEDFSINKLSSFCEAQDLKILPESHHEEIYLSDFRKVAEEKMKTILRYQVQTI